MIGKKIANKITKPQKNSQENNSEKVTYEKDKEIPKYISPKERQKITDNLRTIIIV